MGHDASHKRRRLIGTHIAVPAEIKQIYCTTDIEDNGYCRQEYPVQRRPIQAASTVIQIM